VRKQLKAIDGSRQKFLGTFVRTGLKNGYKGPLQTVLLTNICDERGTLVTDHLWFNLTKGFVSANLSEGVLVEFYARVKKYEKGYKGYRTDVYVPVSTDYKLSHPTKIRCIQSSLV
jgi:hypothetical protein